LALTTLKTKFTENSIEVFTIFKGFYHISSGVFSPDLDHM